MKIGKNYINQLISEEYENIILSELFSKRSASLMEILDNDGNPTQNDIYQSDDFQKNLINDLILNRNVTSFQLFESGGSMDDLQGHDDNSYEVNYVLKFIYEYKGVPIPLEINIFGDVYVNWIGKHFPATLYQPEEHPEPEINEKQLGKSLDFQILDGDGNKINIARSDNGNTWFSPELKAKAAKSLFKVADNLHDKMK